MPEKKVIETKSKEIEIVKTEKGPLLPEELVKAQKWATEVLSKIS